MCCEKASWKSQKECHIPDCEIFFIKHFMLALMIHLSWNDKILKDFKQSIGPRYWNFVSIMDLENYNMILWMIKMIHILCKGRKIRWQCLCYMLIIRHRLLQNAQRMQEKIWMKILEQEELVKSAYEEIVLQIFAHSSLQRKIVKENSYCQSGEMDMMKRLQNGFALLILSGFYITGEEIIHMCTSAEPSIWKRFIIWISKIITLLCYPQKTITSQHLLNIQTTYYMFVFGDRKSCQMNLWCGVRSTLHISPKSLRI